MTIACPNCSTTYVLDERLLPAAGAPVQCTRCAHVFTARASDAQAQERSGTQIFGFKTAGAPASPAITATPVAPSDVPRKDREVTQIFGASLAGAPVAPAATRATQVFGAGLPRPAALDPRSTQVFGAMKPASPPVSNPRSTQMFGAGLTPLQPAPARQTQAFGAIKTDPAASPPTAPGVPPAANGTPPIRMTQVFGAGKVITEPGYPPGLGARRPSGQITAPTFGPVPPGDPGNDKTVSAAHPERTIIGGPDGSAEPAERATLVDLDHGMPRPGLATPPANPAVAPDPYSDDAPVPDDTAYDDDETVKGGGPDDGSVPMMPVDFSRIAGGAQADPAQQLGASLQRRNRLAIFGVLALAAGVIGLFGYKLYEQRRPQLPPAARTSLEDASNRLRRDDPESLKEAAALFKQLAAAYPTFVEARADLLISLMLQLDDAQTEVARLDEQSALLNAKITSLEGARAPSDWQNRVNAMREELQAMKSRESPLNQRIKVLRQEIDAARNALNPGTEKPSPDDQRAILRANAVYLGVAGYAEAQQMAAQYKAAGGADGWDTIAVAEYVANARVNEGLRIQTARDLDELLKRESTFLRGYVLTARLALQAKKPVEAGNALDSVLALNPAHELAKGMLDEVRKQR